MFAVASHRSESAVADFVRTCAYAELPGAVRHQARRCILDTVGVAIAGRRSDLSRIAHDFAARHCAGSGARLWFDGRTISPVGAALANALTIDAVDIHDGHSLCKGHASVALTSALFAIAGCARAPISGQAAIADFVVGSEVALRCGMMLHATAADYHSSGAWNALGCAAIAARRLGLRGDQVRHALGIAEYYGPRSQMMRCIDHPTMVKDGSGWGAHAGVSAAFLAEAGFTGAPAVTCEDSASVRLWNDLGERWHILGQYFKPLPVCRWAQPAVEAALSLQRKHAFTATAIARIRIETFSAAARLATRFPRTTEEAQYSLPFSVAAALVHGGLPPSAITGDALNDPRIMALACRIEVAACPRLDALFPAERHADLDIVLANGTSYECRGAVPRWDASCPPSDEELREKFIALAYGSLGSRRAHDLLEMLWEIESMADISPLIAAIAEPFTSTNAHSESPC
jgi:2-methylcitrate dehydratase PrpD